MNSILQEKSGPNVFDFDATLAEYGLSLTRAPLSELQINVGKLCNQACHHCHVEAGPKRTEIMQRETVDRILDWADKAAIRHADITGGAPELNPSFRYLVESLQRLGATVISRCNLSVLFEPGQEDLAAWYARRQVRLVCSLPCYTQDNVDAQRGKGVFNKSIEALRLLNAHGYGLTEALPLDLVYNPGGAFLPPAQQQLEADYKRRLADDFGIYFSKLLTITNLPISRFAHYLAREHKERDYMQLLRDNFNPATVEGLMCRHLISVDWQGYVYDCDFNQMLDLPLADKGKTLLWDLDPASLSDSTVATDAHCLGCTAGAGSSCGGALA